MKVGSSRAWWRSSWQIATRYSFCSGVRSLGTNFAATRCIFKSHVRIVCTVPSVWHINDCSNVLNCSPTILIHKPPNCFHIFWALSSWKIALTSRRLRVMFCLSWSAHATRNTSHDSWSHFHVHIVSFQKSPLQICQVSRRIWCLLSAPISCPCWNRKCEGTRGDKHLCCTTPSAHTPTPLGILSGNVPCSEAQRMNSRIAIRWRSMELVLKLFDTPTYLLSINLRASCQIGTTTYLHCVFLSMVHCMWQTKKVNDKNAGWKLSWHNVQEASWRMCFFWHWYKGPVTGETPNITGWKYTLGHTQYRWDGICYKWLRGRKLTV